MAHYFFLENQDQTIRAIDQDNFEDIALSDTYGDYGQRVDNSDAGDYFIIDQASADLLNNHQDYDDWHDEPEYYKDGDIISAYDDNRAYDVLENESEIEAEKETVLAYNYWDGHNRCTYYASEAMDDDEKLQKAMDNKVYYQRLRDGDQYIASGYKITNYFYQGNVGMIIEGISDELELDFKGNAESDKVYDAIWIEAYKKGYTLIEGYEIVVEEMDNDPQIDELLWTRPVYCKYDDSEGNTILDFIFNINIKTAEIID